MLIFASTCNRLTGKQLKQLRDGKSPDGRLKQIAFTTNVKDHLADVTGIFFSIAQGEERYKEAAL